MNLVHRSITKQPLNYRPAPTPAIRVLETRKPDHIFQIGMLSWTEDLSDWALSNPFTVGALFELTDHYARGGWSDQDESPSERERNLHALHHGLAIRARYTLEGMRVYFRTDGRRLRTLVSLVEE